MTRLTPARRVALAQAAAILGDPSFLASLTAAEWFVLPYTLGLLDGEPPCHPEPVITVEEVGPLMAAAYRCGRADGERRCGRADGERRR